jgi:CBS domain-containing protein
MPYNVRQLVEGLVEPVTANPEDPIQEALGTMLKNSFSQLPVAKGGEYYFITQESILTALHGFGMAPSEAGLKVEDALIRVHRVFVEDDDLFELLAGMHESNAALVVDEKGLKYVVTAYDTTQFFRQWSEDILHARDIETNLKRIVNAAFKNQRGEIDESARASEIAEITPSNKELQRKFERALSCYLEKLGSNQVVIRNEHLDAGYGELVRLSTRTGEEGKAAGYYDGFSGAAMTCVTRVLKDYLTPDDTIAKEAFSELYNVKEQIKHFDKLTLDQYIQLFLGDVCWGRCSGAFGVERKGVSNLLNGIRVTRNKLAHFQEEEITAQERDQLKMCSRWLGDRVKNALAELEKSAPKVEELDEKPGVAQAIS